MEFSVDPPPYRLWTRALRLGEDWVVCLGGGDQPHVGAVVAAEPRPSLADPGQWSATSSVWNRLGHKDEALARPLAEKLAGSLRAMVVVVGGVHVDGLDASGIQTFLEMGEELARQMVARLAGGAQALSEAHG